MTNVCFEVDLVVSSKIIARTWGAELETYKTTLS